MMMTETTETTLTTLQQRADDIPAELTQDEICSRLMLLDYMKERIRAAEEAMKAGIKLWMEANSVHEFSIGTVRYYIGPDSSPPKCQSVKDTLSAVLLANGCDPREAGIDMDAVCLTLSSNAFKPAATAKMIAPGIYKKLFVKSTATKLHVEGEKAARQLQKIDEQFVR